MSWTGHTPEAVPPVPQTPCYSVMPWSLVHDPIGNVWLWMWFHLGPLFKKKVGNFKIKSLFNTSLTCSFTITPKCVWTTTFLLLLSPDINTNSSHFCLYRFLQNPGLHKASLFNSHYVCTMKKNFHMPKETWHKGKQKTWDIITAEIWDLCSYKWKVAFVGLIPIFVFIACDLSVFFILLANKDCKNVGSDFLE